MTFQQKSSRLSEYRTFRPSLSPLSFHKRRLKPRCIDNTVNSPYTFVKTESVAIAKILVSSHYTKNHRCCQNVSYSHSSTSPLIPSPLLGHKLVRQSSSVLFPGSSRLEFSRGREVWGTPGLTLSVPVTLTNTLTRSATFLVDVRDVLNFPITLLRRR